MLWSLDIVALIRDYTPVLVLYPEIAPGSVRQLNPDYPHASPLFMDYHPRDIRMVLEYSSLDSWYSIGTGQSHTWQETLEAMERSQYEPDLDLLPGIQSSDRDTFWKTYAAVPKDRPEFQRSCYARVAKGRGLSRDRILIQYWYAYFYNDFWNTHEMDWEAVNIVFKLVSGQPRPTICALSAHHGGSWLPWSLVEKAEAGSVRGGPVRSEQGQHPVVYVSNGSHAGYFYGRCLYVTAPRLESMAAHLLNKERRLVDYTSSWEEGSPQLVEAQIIPPNQIGLFSGNWCWLNHKGRWGSRGKWCDLEFGDSGPLGFPRAGDCWDFPFRWIDTTFTRAPSRDEAVMPTLVEPDAR